ncbi:hypothetical protein [Sphingomonas alpina]|uniref:Uncharacterized protein n=1 Tax=Sphingomonas alpina TaxID=653931 RepID=A0A7H0LFU9_9SPHN|nr:hypothetical protein [Sphingomonas alpina]QNQ08552.1 hypothetical protein H3Z74_17635 [Sphingomonas alpina]
MLKLDQLALPLAHLPLASPAKAGASWQAFVGLALRLVTSAFSTGPGLRWRSSKGGSAATQLGIRPHKISSASSDQILVLDIRWQTIYPSRFFEILPVGSKNVIQSSSFYLNRNTIQEL